MSTAVIGQFLATSLYQAISETTPHRVDFYAAWLTPRGFRAKHVYIAGVHAVLSFLRLENGAYDTIVRRAGALAAQWLHDDLPPLRRRLMHALPARLRCRAALFLAREVVRGTWSQSRVSIRWKRGAGSFAIQASVFCDVRNGAREPLCGFYAAALESCFTLLGLEAVVRADHCHASGGGDCMLGVSTPYTRDSGAAVIAGALVLAAAIAAPASAQLPMPQEQGRVLVMPFEYSPKPIGIAWLGEGSSILLSDELRASGVDAMTRDERLHAFDRFQIPPRATLSLATVIRIGEAVGAGDVVFGALSVEAETLELKARRFRLGPGRLDQEAAVRGPLANMAGLCRDLAARLWASDPGEPLPAVASGFTGMAVPLAAFEQYVKGLMAETPATQLAFLSRAITIHGDFPAARLALGQSRSAAGDYKAALDAVQPIGGSSPVATQARLVAALAHIALRDYAAAFRVLTDLQARTPSAVFLNALGVVRLRASSLPAGAGSATWYFNQARMSDPLEPDYLFNLGYAYWLDDDHHAAAYWLREALRLGPTDAAVHALLAQVLQADGQPTEAARELALAQRLSSDYGWIDLKTGQPPAPRRGLERLKEGLDPPRPQRLDVALEMAGQRDQRQLSTFYLQRGRLAFNQENDRDAESDLARALYLWPYDPEAHLLLGRIYLRTGRLREAIDALKVSTWSEDSAAARVTLAEAYLESRDTAAALAEAERALVLDPNSIHARQLVERLRQALPPV